MKRWVTRAVRATRSTTPSALEPSWSAGETRPEELNRRAVPAATVWAGAASTRSAAELSVTWVGRLWVEQNGSRRGTRRDQCTCEGSVRQRREHTFVKPKTHEQAAARSMRANGLSLRQIAGALDVSLNSAWRWTRDVLVPEAGLGSNALDQAPVDPIVFHCARCARDLTSPSFHWSRAKRQSWCRECRSSYMRERGALHRRQTYEARRRRRNAARAYILERLAAGSCTDCGVTDPFVLEFDHVGPKKFNVADLVAHGYAISVVAREVAACELVCVNCHRRRTARRAGSWRADPASPHFCAGRPLRRRNLEFIHSHLADYPCVDCGEADIVVLDFDHLGEKKANVVDLAWGEHCIASIEQEIAGCAVRCANCHRRRTCRTLNQFRNDGCAPVAQLA